MLEGSFLELASDGSKLKGSTGGLDSRRLRVFASSRKPESLDHGDTEQKFESSWASAIKLGIRMKRVPG